MEVEENMTELLAEELKTYETHKAELVGQAPGKYVLVKDSRIVGIFDTEMDAVRQGYERFGNVPFLVKQIVEVEVPLEFTSNLLAV
jgi:hypothetical protein